MKLLLDTCTFLWLNADAPELSLHARELCLDVENDIYLSVVSSWEITVKWATGKLHLPDPPARYVPSRRRMNGIHSLPLNEEATLHAAKLPAIHSDPFDRMLVCQALVHGLVILTPDERIAQYPVRIAW